MEAMKHPWTIGKMPIDDGDAGNERRRKGFLQAGRPQLNSTSSF